MDFNQLFNHFKGFCNIPLMLKIARTSAYIAGTLIILATLIFVIGGQWKVIGTSLKFTLPAIKAIITVGAPRFFQLVLASLGCLWLPILLYIVISVIAVSRWGRFYLCLATLCGFILVFKTLVINDISLSSLFEVLIYLMQIYLLLLWTVPRELWNFIGGAFWLLQSVIVLVIPDFPGYFDDFGFITAIFSFIFLYLHTTASLVQRFVDTQVVTVIRNYLTQIFKQNLNED